MSNQLNFNAPAAHPKAPHVDEDELHRYVTEEMPRTAKMSSSTSGAAGLIVSIHEPTQ